MSKARDLANAGTALTTVSATELGYLDGVTSAVQTQLNAKQAVVSGVSDTEIGYLDGVTSAIQTQIDSKITGSSAIAPTIVDAKGDIIAASAADTVARLAVGANDTVLTADSSTATGLKWAAPSSINPNLRQTISGYYVGTPIDGGSNAQPPRDVTYYSIVFLYAGTYDRISVRTGANNTGTSQVRLGLYNVNATTGKPSTLAFDAGLISTTAPSTNYEITISQTLATGYYYLAFNMQSSTGTDYYHLASPSIFVPGVQNVYTTSFGGSLRGLYTQTGVTGAFATAGTLTESNSAQPMVRMRMA